MPGHDRDAVVVDLSRKETEWGWLGVVDAFYTAITPAWFTWLGWVAALSALEYVGIKTGSAWARSAWLLSEFLLVMYFCALFARLRLSGIPRVKSDRVAYLISSVVAGVAAIVAGTASVKIAEALTAATR